MVKSSTIVINPMVMTLIMAGYLVLFFSVHGYMDFRMFREAKKRSSKKSIELEIPFWTKILAFTPSLVFWVLFIGSPFLFYSGWYKHLISPFLAGKNESVIQGVGLGLVVAGVILADWGRVSRGVIAPSRTLPDKYRLSTRGAYRLVRHPMYVSYTLFFIGLPLVFLSVPLLLCIAGSVGYYQIAREEEKILLEKFGEEYKAYQEYVGMFFPRM